MLTAATSTSAPTAIGVGLAVLVVVLLWWSMWRSPRRDRVAWADFERQFAEYVADRADGPQAPQTRDPRDRADERRPETDRPSARRPD